MQLRLLTLAAASIGAVAGFFLSVGFWSIQEWAKPLEPMTYLGVALLIVYAVLVGAWVSVTRKDAQLNPAGGETARTRSFKRLVALMFQVLVGVIALLVSSLWALDGVRVTTLELFKDRGPLLYMQALDDPSARVAEKACDLLFDTNVIRFEKPLTQALVNRPGVAARCLATARKKGLFGVEMVGNSLLTKWRKDVMSAGARETAFACERVEQFSAVSELSDLGGGDLSLLQCSVAAESEQVRQCCASALASHGDVAQLLGFAENLTTEEAVELFPSLVLQSFRPLSLSAADQTVATSLKMDSEEKRRWVLSLGCSLMARGQQRDVLRGFVPIIEGTTCNLSAQSRVAFSKTEAWVQLCPEVDELPTDQPVEKQLCDLFTASSVATAVQKAHNVVMAATRAMSLEASANTIDDGGKASAAAAKSNNPFAAENVRIVDFEPSRTPVNPYSADGRCFKVEMDANSRLDRLRAGDNIFRVVPSHDCDSKWGPDYTAADAWRDRRATLRSAVKDGGVEAGDASKVEKKNGANAVRVARERMAKQRNASR